VLQDGRISGEVARAELSAAALLHLAA
jgi:hypothetical protein